MVSDLCQYSHPISDMLNQKLWGWKVAEAGKSKFRVTISVVSDEFFFLFLR
jgi:hypothetical protein